MTGFKKVFLDTAPIIYFLERSDLYYEKMKSFFQFVIDHDIALYTSAITYEEYEVGPLRKDNQALISAFERFIRDMEIHVINIDPAVASYAASIRVEYPGYKAMDSLQIASAFSAGCDLFLTNDKQLRQTHQITCKTVDDISIA